MRRFFSYLLSRKTISVILTIISIVLTLVCTVELVRRLMTIGDDVVDTLLELATCRWLIILELVLFVINISLESLKWWLINGRNYQHFKWWHIYETVFIATAFGGATPGRVGEHVARLQDGKNHSDALAGSLISSVVQTTVIVVFAIIVPIAYSLGYVSRHDISSVDITELFVVVWIVIAVMIIIVPLVAYLLRRWRNNEYMQRITVKRLSQVFVVNTLRYIVFVTQLVLLLSIDNWELMPRMYMFATLYYLLITILPSINIIDIGVKNEMAIIAFGSLVSESVIFTSIFVVWLINTCLPSFIGLALNIRKVVRRTIGL